jgi:hypothetical protein
MLGLTLDTAHHKIPQHVLRIRESTKIAQAKLDDLASLGEPATDADDLSSGLAWPTVQQQDHDAVLQSTPPEIVPSIHVRQHHAALTNAAYLEPEQG